MCMIHMPVKAKRNEAIAALRKVLNLSQVKFGAMIGATRDTVVSWECGRNRLSDKFAWRIEMATGCAAGCLLRGRSALVGIFKQPYSRAYFDDWRKRLQKSDAETAKQYAEFGADALGLILLAAAQPGRHSKDRLPAVWTALVEWLAHTAEDFKLKPELDALLSKRRLRQSDRATYGYFRQASLNPDWQKWWQFKDDKRKPDSALITLTRETHPAWNPGGICARALLGNLYRLELHNLAASLDLGRHDVEPFLGLVWLHPAAGSWLR